MCQNSSMSYILDIGKVMIEMKQKKTVKHEWKDYDPTKANLIIIGLVMVMVIALIVMCAYSAI